MLWYLLYPIRRTTQPPRLSANHPVRRAFYRHGKTTAQHWLVAMLVTVAIAMAFSYPTILWAEDPTAGLASYPHHVWTTAKPYEGNPQKADVEMRQVWVHGSYMKALDKDVLKRALDIQQTLVGSDTLASLFPALSERLRFGALTWGYHSPLMYWNNSQAAIDDDDDVRRTINERSRTISSSMNVPLRPASVFAGKKFEHQRLTAADALVITLMNKAQVGVSDPWSHKMKSLSTGACQTCTLYPRDGHVTRNRVYEFSFTPLSAHENIALTIAYSGMALYVLLSLRRLKAFHSRFGLVVTAITQMTCSILASFTICGILKINLSMIPQNAYPFVVLVMGIENMFRIINAVLAYPPTMATDLRLANALGDVGPVSLATAVQNAVILAVLARVVSPGVAAFCAFACIATLFDAFYLLTFFVAVLMVDIRRFELQDALSRANQAKQRRRPSPAQHTWFDALVHGRLPFSTRMAGTAVTTTFILSLNYHFFEHKEKATSLRHLLRLIRDGPPTMNDFDTFIPLPVNASQTPGQWMRMQDFDTTKEVMRLAKPGADSFIIRIFAPLIVVLSGSDRTDIDEQEAWTTALRSFAIHHFYPVAVAVVFAVAFVAVLMNFLLYTEHADEPGTDLEREEEEALKVQTVALPHKLDIEKLSGNDRGHFVSAALDRTIAIALFDRIQQTHRVVRLTRDALSRVSWPIHSIRLDESGDWMACHCGDDQILIYDVIVGSFIDEYLPYPDDNPPLLFEFVRLACAESIQLHFLVLTSGGRLSTVNIVNGESKATRLANVPLLGAGVTDQGKRVVVVTDEAKILAYSWTYVNWTLIDSQILEDSKPQYRWTGAVRIEQHSESSADLLVIATSKQVFILNSQSLEIISKLDTRKDEPSIGTFLLGQSARCQICGLLAFRCVAFVGEVANESECTITTLWAKGSNDAVICLRKGSASCQSFDEARRTAHPLRNPGAWMAIRSQGVLGLRRVEDHRVRTPYRKDPSNARLRRRRHAHSNTQPDDVADLWQAYKLALDGETDTVDIVENADADADLGTSLFVNNAGPVAPLDSQSIAVAFGNSVKVLRSVRRGSMARRPTGRTFERQHANSKDGTMSLRSR